ncbi:MAG: hypothetical protein ACKVJG_15170 [Candidatus Latescibacterota bacterium]
MREHFDDIEGLGGVATPFVTHNHDVGGVLVEAVQDRFASKLCYHSAEQDAVAEKTKCPSEVFGDEGLRVGSDFHGIYFPSCCAGSSLYHWQHGERHFLFTSHVINPIEGEWQNGLDLWQYRNLREWGDREMPPDPRPQLAKIADLPLDYSMPNVYVDGQEEYHQFSDETRTSFFQAIEEQTEAGAKHVQATNASNRT